MTWDDLIKALEESGKDLVQDYDENGPVNGYYWHKGLLRNKLGTWPAWILKDHASSGEHSGTIVKIGKVWYVQGLNDMPVGFFPYKYRVATPCPGDIHDHETF